MTLFGKSLFESVLAGFEPDKDDQEDEEIVHHPVRGLNAGFVGRDFHGDHISDVDPVSHFETLPAELEALLDAKEPAPELHEPSWLDRLTDAEIAEDIGLADGLTRQQLQEKRRQFARENHPDRVPSQYQAIANLRMMAANQLIDRAIKALRP